MEKEERIQSFITALFFLKTLEIALFCTSIAIFAFHYAGDVFLPDEIIASIESKRSFLITISVLLVSSCLISAVRAIFGGFVHGLYRDYFESLQDEVGPDGLIIEDNRDRLLRFSFATSPLFLRRLKQDVYVLSVLPVLLMALSGFVIYDYWT